MEAASEPTSTRMILRDILAKKLSKNPSFSMRAFARDLGVSHTYLSLVLSGKKTLSMKRVIHFTHILSLDEKETSAFLRAASKEARGHAFERIKLESSRPKRVTEVAEYFEIETDRFRLLNDWYHVPIMDLTMVNGFKSDPKWIAQKLCISVEQVRDAIERLKRLGLLEERDGQLIKSKTNMIVRPKRPDDAIRSFHRQMIGKGLEALESVSAEDREARDITGVTIAVDPRKLPEAKQKIAKFRLGLMKFLSDGECTELYQLNVQLFSLTKKSTSSPKLIKVASRRSRGTKK